MKSVDDLVARAGLSHDHALLLQFPDADLAVEAARRIHRASPRAGKAFVVFDARLLDGVPRREALRTLALGAASLFARAARGTLVVMHVDRAEESLQEAFADLVAHRVFCEAGDEELDSAACDARLIFVESPGDGAHARLRSRTLFLLHEAEAEAEEEALAVA